MTELKINISDNNKLYQKKKKKENKNKNKKEWLFS